MGIGIKIKPFRGKDGQIDVEASLGLGKYHPGGSICVYHGIAIDCFTVCSGGGGNTAEILVRVI